MAIAIVIAVHILLQADRP